MPILIAVLTICLVLLFYVLCLRTNGRRKEALKPFTEGYIAHRGLFDRETVPENSLVAFREAVRAGYAVELDVRLTKDEVPVVFHDATLTRMCGVEKMVADCTYEELCGYPLANTGIQIPTFEEALKEIAGDVPVLVEIKTEKEYQKTAEKTAMVLDAYTGIYAVQSFRPSVLVWFRKYRPQVLRGQLSTAYRKDKMKSSLWQRIVGSDLVCNICTCPDFISFRHTMTGMRSYRICKCLYHTVCFAWTVRSEEDLNRAEKEFDGIIFDSFCPTKKR